MIPEGNLLFSSVYSGLRGEERKRNEKILCPKRGLRACG
jgi:hypothetical protein